MTFPQNETVESLEDYSAVQLFLEGAKRVQPDFSLTEDNIPYIVRICRLVSGMPLAIELASGWMHTLSCKEVVEEVEQNIDFLSTSMRDVPERHRSMRAVFEHSWNLLSEKEKEVFMSMSVFRGGLRREAGEKVTGASLPVLLSLVHKSLLRRNPSERYEVHELLRQYAEEKLGEVPKDEQKVHDLHCEFYGEFLLQRRELLTGEKQKEILKEIGEEIENARAAWLWAVEEGKEETINKCLDILWRFYMMRGWHQEGEEMLRRAAERLASWLEETEDEKRLVIGRVLKRQGIFSYRLGHYEKAKELLEKCLPLFGKLDDQREIADTLNELGHVTYIHGGLLKGKQFIEESLAIYKKIGYPKGMAAPYTTLGNIALRLGELEEARGHYQKSFAIYEERGDLWGMAVLLMNLGIIAQELGEFIEAKRLYEESLVKSRELGDRRGIASNLNNMGNVAKELGEYMQARELFQESLEIKREIGDRKGIVNSLGNLGNVASALGQYDEATKYHQEALTMSEEIGFRWGKVSALVGLGNDSCALGETQKSRKYLYEALRIATDISAVPILLDVIIGIASLSTTDKEKALEFLTFVLHHPRAYIHTKNRAEQVSSELRAQLEPHVVSSAEKRGRSRDLGEVVEAILREEE